VEVLRTTGYIRDCVENKEKTKLIRDAIAAGTSQYGMQTFDQSIYTLYKRELITMDEALRRCTNPEEFKLKLQGIESTADAAAGRWRGRSGAPKTGPRRTPPSSCREPSSERAEVRPGSRRAVVPYRPSSGRGRHGSARPARPVFMKGRR